MTNLLVAAAVLVIPLGAVAAPTKTVTITATAQPRIHRGDTFGIQLTTVNTTATRQTFRIMTCGWVESWRSDDPQLGPAIGVCDKNYETTLALEPGGVDIRTLSLAVSPKASLGLHTVRFGFTPIGATTPIWSSAVELQVVEPAGGVTLTGKLSRPRTIAFTLTNTTSHPVELADRVALQREVAGAWTDMTWTSLTGVGGKAACTTIAPGRTVDLTWDGMTCWQPICAANTRAGAGRYRVVAQSCDGTGEYVGTPVSLP
jgi:hypothetical protein